MGISTPGKSAVSSAAQVTPTSSTPSSCGTKTSRARRTVNLAEQVQDSELLDSVFEAQEWSVAEVARFSEWLKNDRR